MSVAVITNGTTGAALRFAGHYVTESFSANSDGHGGILIKDPPVPAALCLADFGGIAGPTAAGGSACGGGTCLRRWEW